VTRINRAVLAAFLCSATAPAAMCEVTPQMSPFNAGQWSALEDTRATTSRAMAEPNTFTPDAIELPDATILLPKSSTAGGTTRAPVNALPVTSTAPAHEPESGLR
jgi:hypothetical protein